jgi:monofunctional glycosyltransferase
LRTENRRRINAARSRSRSYRRADEPAGSLPLRVARWLFVTIVAGFLLTLGMVLVLRTVNPPGSAFMAQAWLGGLARGEPLTIDQRWVSGACISPAIKLAVLAAEDQKFAVHRGFDFAQIADARKEAERGGRVRGASTLTQQTAKNLFLWSGQSWLRKGLEAGLTVLIETLWSKQRILEVYLNIAEFGPGIYGVEAAARRYFGKPAAALTEAESALLAAVLPNPRVLQVAAPSDYVRERQATILRQLRPVAGLPRVARLIRPTDHPAGCGAGN